MSEIRVKPDESLDSAPAPSPVCSPKSVKENTTKAPVSNGAKRARPLAQKKDLIADFQAVYHVAHRLCSRQNQRPADFSAGLLHYHLTIL